jgi:hypothetical protein
MKQGPLTSTFGCIHFMHFMHFRREGQLLIPVRTHSHYDTETQLLCIFNRNQDKIYT